MKQILAVNQKFLRNPILNPVLSSVDPGVLGMLEKFSSTGYFATSTQLGLMPRAGVNNLPFSNHVVDKISAQMPVYDPTFSKSWEEITNERCIEIKKLIGDSGKLLVVQWSGGIDSTCIVTSILKNFSLAELKQVIIACNWGSILENPDFYHNHILTNFQTIDINFFTTNEFHVNHKKYLVVNGMPADVLLQSVAGLDLCMALGDSNLLTRSWRKDPDGLIKYLSRITDDHDFGQWYFELLSHNINSVDIPVETYFDFTWWGGFNYHWVAQRFFEWFANHSDQSISWQDHISSFYYWYDTIDYQKWAMINNRPGIKYGNHIGQLKLVSKKYIFDYTKDTWYYKYKVKMGSPGRNTQNAERTKAFAVCDDFTILYLDQHRDEIQALLPAYIRL